MTDKNLVGGPLFMHYGFAGYKQQQTEKKLNEKQQTRLRPVERKDGKN